MTLREWLSTTFTPVPRFAEAVGCSKEQAYRYVRRQCRPRPETAKRIVRLTKGAVGLGDLMDVER